MFSICESLQQLFESMKAKCIIPQSYSGEFNKRITEDLVHKCQTRFEQLLMENLNLQLVSAPLFLPKESGLNDDLNGVENAVSFSPPGESKTCLEIVHSLAKWKRNYLSTSYFSVGEGIVTRMNAIRKDEELSNIHSFNVDQWDWEKIIPREERTVGTLQKTVNTIYEALLETQKEMRSLMEPKFDALPEKIRFIYAEKLRKDYPDLTPKERERKVVEEHKAVFIMGIGGKLDDGKPHDLRAPDYDDWSTVENGFAGLNGDLLVWNPVLNEPIEISSMGIRVDAKSLLTQLSLTGTMDRLELPFHSKVMSGEVPFTIGGGIGRSRLTMFLLEKAHIGEVQQSYWPKEVVDQCKHHQIVIL